VIGWCARTVLPILLSAQQVAHEVIFGTLVGPFLLRSIGFVSSLFFCSFVQRQIKLPIR